MNVRASQGERLAGLSGVVLILIMLLFAWYGIHGAPSGVNGLDAFDAYSDWVDLILLAAAICGICLGLFGASAFRLQAPVSLSVITAALGLLAAVVILIFLLSTPSIDLGGAQSFDTDRKLGAFLGLLAALGVAAGGYLAMQEEGTSFEDAADRLSSGRGRREPADASAGTTPAQSERPSSPPPPPPPPPPPASGP